MMDEGIRLVSERKSDAETAQEHKAELTAALEDVTQVMDRIRASGFWANFALGVDYAGRSVITSMEVFKVF